MVGLLLAGCAPSALDDGADTGSSSASDGGDEGSSDGGSSDGGSSDGGDEDGSDGGSASYTVSINEWMASNSEVTVDPEDAEATPDWIELYNPSELTLDLEGFTITDDLADPTRHTLPSIVLEPGDFVVLIADGGTGDLHLPFKLSAEGEQIGVFDPSGVPLDQVEYENLGESQVAGRLPDGGTLHILSAASPGESNSAAQAVDP